MAGKYKLTKDQSEEMARLYIEERYSIEKLTKIFNVNKATIRRYLKSNSIKMRLYRVEIKPGDKFNRWTVIKEAEKRGGHRRYFLCECSCGSGIKKEISISNLKNGGVQSCGCIKRESARNRRESVIGNVYGKITIISETNTDSKRRRKVMGQCSCDGNIREYSLPDLKNGVQSCGCYSREKVREAKVFRKIDYEEKHPLLCRIEEIRDRVDEDKETGLGIEVRCKKCNGWFKPTTRQLWTRIKAIENPDGFEQNYFYCSDECKSSCILFNLKSDPFDIKEINNNVPSNNELSIWRDEVLKRQFNEYGYNFCTKCQSVNDLDSHHIDPKKLEPGLSLDPENGIVFCSKCHYKDGHGGECSSVALANTICK